MSKTFQMVRQPIVVVVLLLTSLASNASWAKTPIAEQAVASLDGRISIDNVSGSIRILGWDQPLIKLSGTLGKGAELVFRVDGNQTLISVERKSAFRNMKSTHLIIEAPQRSELTVVGVSADLEVQAMLAPQRLQTVSGDIDTQAFAAELDLSSVSGDVRVQGHSDSLTEAATRFDVDVVSGDIEIDNVTGELQLNSVSGGISVADSEVSRLKADSTSGQIELALALSSKARVRAETISGDVSLDITQGESIEVDVQTHSGDLNSCTQEPHQRKSQYGPGRSLSIRRGEAERSVRIETLSGDVDICAPTEPIAP